MPVAELEARAGWGFNYLWESMADPTVNSGIQAPISITMDCHFLAFFFRIRTPGDLGSNPGLGDSFSWLCLIFQRKSQFTTPYSVPSGGICHIAQLKHHGIESTKMIIIYLSSVLNLQTLLGLASIQGREYPFTPLLLPSIFPIDLHHCHLMGLTVLDIWAHSLQCL